MNKLGVDETVTPQRTKRYQRSAALEEVLTEVNELLASVEVPFIKDLGHPDFPVILVMGAPRSGTTLTMQWLAASGQIAYPTNLISRFYGAPYIGARIQQILVDFDIRGELLGNMDTMEFKSDLGKTRRPLSPNEFWYFWRRFFPERDNCVLTDAVRTNADTRTFVSELAGLVRIFQKPFAMKGAIITWDIPYIASLIKNVLFVHVVRDEFLTCQSLLEARERFFGDRKYWYSFKPPQYASLSTRPPCEQVAGHVHFMNRATEAGLCQIDRHSWMTLKYEDLCSDPAKCFKELCTKLGNLGLRTSDWAYSGPDRFEPSNSVHLAPDDERAIRKAIDRFDSEHTRKGKCTNI